MVVVGRGCWGMCVFRELSEGEEWEGWREGEGRDLGRSLLVLRVFCQSVHQHALNHPTPPHTTPHHTTQLSSGGHMTTMGR